MALRLQQFPQKLGPGLIAGLMGVDQLSFQMCATHGVIDIVVLLVGLPGYKHHPYLTRDHLGK